MRLKIFILGPFKASVDGEAVEVSSRRSRALLAMLAAAPGMSLARSMLADTLWSGRSEEQARASLRQELANLRRALPVGALTADAERVRLSAEADIAALFDDEVAEDAALDLLRGTFLDGLELPGGFSDWQEQTRREVADRIMSLARRLGDRARGDQKALTLAADRILALSPYDEGAFRWRMQALAADGRRAAALEAYDAFAALLKAELNIAPEADTIAVRDEIQSGALARRASAAEPVGEAAMTRPAVLFLPFEALGGSEDDALFALGLCEDIRTTLACWRWFPVIGPEALRGLTGDIRSLAAAVDAAYVATGSVRRSGERARVSARLIDAGTGLELWSQTFDGDLRDVFEFQEDVSRRIVSQIEPEIARAAAARFPVSRPRDLSSWELMVKVKDAERRGGDGYGTKESNAEISRYARAALELDQNLGEAWARVAQGHFRGFLLGWAEDGAAALAEALKISAHAVEVDPSNSNVRAYRAQCILFGEHDAVAALEHARESVRLNPSNVIGHIMLGCVLVYFGDPDRAYAHYQTALRLNPNFSNPGVVYCDQMMCRALSGALDEAVALARKTMTVAPKYYRGLQRCAAVLAHAGQVEEARRILARTEEIGGAFSESYVRETYPFVVPEHLDYLIEGLRKAGWTS